MRVRLLVSEALRSIVANISTTVAATMTVLIGMFLLGLAIALGTWTLSWTDYAKERLLVKVYFCTEITCGREATGPEIEAVRTALRKMPEVEQVTFVSKEQGLEKIKETQPRLRRSIGTFDCFSRPRSRPPTMMRPEVGSSSFKSSRTSVDLPEPEAPTMKTNSPFSIRKETLSSATMSGS